eukprot:3763677-Rhodomonas_salina.3
MSNRIEVAPLGAGVWSAEEDAQWTKELQARLDQNECSQCKSRKIADVLVGRPYMKYVEWNTAMSEKLGWKTLHLGGCDPSQAGAPRCVDCSKE